MPQTYRFVGTELSIGEKKLTKFGQEIQLTDEQRKDAGPNAPLVHDDLFQKVGFTEQELSLYARLSERIGAPDVFQSKVRAAWALVGQEPQASSAQVIDAHQEVSE